MTTKASRIAATKVRAMKLPRGLDELEASVRIPAKDFAFSDVAKAFVGKSGFYVGSTKGRRLIRGALSGRGTLAAGHAHFEIRERPDQNEFSLSVTFLHGSHVGIAKSSATIPFAINSIKSAWRASTDTQPTLVSSNYSFALKEWEPTIPLPFTPLAMTEDLAGLPQICGVDVAFQDRSPSQQLQRAFVTTYDGIDMMVIRMLLACTCGWDDDLPSTLLNLVARHLPVLARKRKRDQ